MANFDSEFFGLVFPGFQATQKIQAQNSRPELSAFLSNFTFLNPKFIHGDFLLTGATNNFGVFCRGSFYLHCPPIRKRLLALLRARLRGRNYKVTESAQSADFRRFFCRFTPSPGNSSIWRAQETAGFSQAFRRIFADWVFLGPLVSGRTQV